MFQLAFVPLSFTPGFSPVKSDPAVLNRFNGFPWVNRNGKPLKRFLDYSSRVTGLKPGVNESFKLNQPNFGSTRGRRA